MSDAPGDAGTTPIGDRAPREVPPGFRVWLQDQYDNACRAAADARRCRRWPGRDGNPCALEHASATARMCALGETIARLDRAGGEIHHHQEGPR